MEWIIWVGILLFAFELVIPGFGIFGFVGLLCILWGIYELLGGGPTALAIVCGLAMVGVILLWWMIQKFPHTRLGKSLTLKLRSTAEKGYESHPDPSRWLGKMGITKTVLRPSGTIVIDTEYVDVVTEGEFYEVGIEVQVIAVTGSRIVVRSVEK